MGLLQNPAILLGALLASSLAAAAQPQIGGPPSCTAAGTYAYAISGDVQAPGVGSAHYADSGLLIVSSNNSVTGKSTASNGGVVTSRTLTGTYQASSACEGTLSINDNLGNHGTLAVAFHTQSTEGVFVQQQNGTAISGSATRIAAPCNAAAIAGSYGYSLFGTIKGAQFMARFASSGQLNVNPDGSLTASDVASDAGVIANRALTGSASISADCTGAATLKDQTGATTHLNIVFLPETKRILFIQTDSGATVSGYSRPVIGACAAASGLNGTFAYALSGFYGYNATTNASSPLADSGQMKPDGNGSFSGTDTFSQNGQSGSRTIHGAYAFASDCQGLLTFQDSLGGSGHLHFILVEGGARVLFIQSDASTVVSGEGTKVTRTCQNLSLNGTYSYALSGYVVSQPFPYFADMGVLIADGAGNLSGHSSYSQNGVTGTRTLQGRYSIDPATCTGTANISPTDALAMTVTDTGAAFVETQAGTVISGSTSGKEFPTVADAVVNGADFSALHLVPGAIVSIFGSGLSTLTTGAANVPLPNQLGGTTFTLSGKPMPLFYVSPGQVNAQVPWETPVGVNQISVSVNGTPGTSTPILISPGFPEFFTYPGGAVAIKLDGSTVGPANPAHAGDTLVVYLNSAGSVAAAGPLVTGAASPAGLSKVTGAVQVTVGGQIATAAYTGLTPGSVGLYQTNILVPNIPEGTQPIVLYVGGQASAVSTIVID